MVEINLKHYSHKVGTNYWHFEWCTKYRCNMMQKLELKNLVQAAKEHKIQIRILKVLPDQIHMLVTLPNNMTDSKARMLLKGRSAYLIFRNRENIKLRYPRGNFWSAGSCAVTVGYNDLSSMIKYIENQEVHHGLISA